MDTSHLLSCIHRERSERKGISALAFQNHLYGCFIVMEDIAQGILDVEGNHITGNALYLNLDTQFGQIGIRYYGFVMDGKAILESVPVDYKEGWCEIFRGVKNKTEEVDRIEDEIISVLRALEGVEENYFLQAMEHDGSLSADAVERVLYLLHPELEEKKVEKPMLKKGKGQKDRRGLSVTRRNRKKGKEGKEARETTRSRRSSCV